MNDAQLLQSFVEHSSETAFRTLVERHLPLVFGTARRITGESALAEEVAQTVFILLARKARNLGPGTILSGWLYRAARFVAARALRSEQRRRRREQEAVTMQLNADSYSTWQRVAPRLDDALGRLGETDRNALLLRFFEQCSMRDVGASLGLSEEAAKKRVARALEKVRRIISRRGTEVSTAALIAGLTHEGSAAAACSGLATKISAMTLTHLASGAGMAAGGSALLAEVLAAWRWAKVKAALAGVTGLITVALLIPAALRSVREGTGTVVSTSNAIAVSSATRGGQIGTEGALANLQPAAIEIAGQTIPLRSLRVTVLDAQSSEPISGAVATHPLTGLFGGSTPAPLASDSNGTVNILVPESLPGGDRMDYFSVDLSAKDYAPRTINWLSTTGNVLGIVSTQYTVRLEPGIALSGTVVDDAGRPPRLRCGPKTSPASI